MPHGNATGEAFCKALGPPGPTRHFPFLKKFIRKCKSNKATLADSSRLVLKSYLHNFGLTGLPIYCTINIV